MRPWLLLVVALVGLPGVARAQPETLSELKASRDAARDAHHDAVVQTTLARQATERLQAQLDRLTARVRTLQAQPGGVLRDSQLQGARRDQNHVARQLANLTLRLRALEDARQVRRLKLIHASWGWVARLLETADRAFRIGRRKQAQEYTDLALLELERLEALEALVDTPQEPFAVEPLRPDAPADELRELRELYAALEESFEEQLRDLEPVEARLASRVQHLDRLVRYAYAIPTLGERLRRARADLERVSGLRQTAQTRSRRCTEQIQAIDRTLSERGLQPADGG